LTNTFCEIFEKASNEVHSVDAYTEDKETAEIREEIEMFNLSRKGKVCQVANGFKHANAAAAFFVRGQSEINIVTVDIFHIVPAGKVATASEVDEQLPLLRR
jgi:hypothetical protein